MLWAVKSTRPEAANRVDRIELDCVSNTGPNPRSG